MQLLDLVSGRFCRIDEYDCRRLVSNENVGSTSTGAMKPSNTSNTVVNEVESPYTGGHAACMRRL
jgi:hypothetical protein